MKRIACIILILSLCFTGLFFVKTAYGTTVGGTLSTDTHWTQTDSPVSFKGVVTISDGATLTIDSGVIVNLGYYYLSVSGTLVAIGDVNNEISFTASGNNTSNYFTEPIVFSPSSTSWSDSTNSGSIIRYANFNSVYLDLNGSPKIDNCQFTLASTSQVIISVNNGSPVITNNTITYNKQGSYPYASSISIFGGTPLIDSNRFNGVSSSSASSDISVSSGSPVITNNVFEGQYSISNIGIKLGSSNSQITNNQFQGKSSLNAILASSFSDSTISNNVFTNCVVGVTVQSQSQLTIKGNSFLKGTDGLDVSFGSTPTIADNLIDSNSRYGIDGGGYIDSNTITNNLIGIHNPPAGTTISNNNIVSNTENSITATNASIDATNNWWGIVDTQTINKTIYDSKVDNALGTISFVPFLTNPSRTAPAIPNSTPIVTAVPSQAPTLTPTDPLATPTSSPFQYSQSFIYQASAVLNLNLIATVTSIILIVAWVTVILGYSAKRAISKYRSDKGKDKKN